MEHEAGERSTHRRNQRAMPPDEIGCRVHEADGLPREQDLQEVNAFAERDARKSSAEPDQSGPENNGGEVLVAKQDQSESRQQ